MMNNMEQMPDPEQLREIMDVVTEKVPDLLEKITRIITDAHQGEQMGNSVATFYRTLIESGMPPHQAFELTRGFMSSASIGGIVSNMGRDFAGQKQH
jgi:hypothetical protein